ncbi:MAG: cytochrome c oxidase assembly protein [Actinomycetota bacterium]|nr:cytochrome c oxidase assembly protein [Actinomycetota bacterium]
MLAHSPGWQLEPVVLAAGALAVGLFAQGFVRLRRRGRRDHAGWDRAALFGLAVALVLAGLVSPLDGLAEEALSAHMLQHVLIGDLAPALAMLALRGPLSFFILPPGLLGPLARSRALRAAGRFLLRPRVAFALWTASILGWHVPRAYGYALAHPWAHELEHGCFIFTGVLVWALLVDPARRGELTVGGRIGLAVAMFVVGQLLTDALIFSSSPHYAAYRGAHGLSALSDQRVAGLVMMLEQLATLGTCIAVLLWPYLTRRRQPALGPEPG